MLPIAPQSPCLFRRAKSLCVTYFIFPSLICRSFENNLTTYRLLSHRTADSELPNVSSLVFHDRTVPPLTGSQLKVLFIYFFTSDSVDCSVRYFLIRCIVVL